MSRSPKPRAPRAFALDEANLRISDEDEFTIAGVAPGDMPELAAPRPRRTSSFGWGRLLFASLGALAAVAIGAAIADLINALFATGGWIGWLALGLAALAGLAVLAITIREMVGIARLAHLRRLREAASAPVLSDVAAREIDVDLARLYASRPELAGARAEVASHRDEIVDPPDRLAIAERAYMPILDAEARRLIGDAAKRVSVVTAVSPAAAIDLGFVLIAQLGLIRKIAALYGGRPGAIGLIRLARLVITHLAVTGSIAIGDDLIQQLVGHGLAARLSARLGEGVLNGLMTARVGLAALDVCRPLPFQSLPRPRVTDFVTASRPGQTVKAADTDR